MKHFFFILHLDDVGIQGQRVTYLFQELCILGCRDYVFILGILHVEVQKLQDYFLRVCTLKYGAAEVMYLLQFLTPMKIWQIMWRCGGFSKSVILVCSSLYKKNINVFVSSLINHKLSLLVVLTVPQVGTDLKRYIVLNCTNVCKQHVCTVTRRSACSALWVGEGGWKLGCVP